MAAHHAVDDWLNGPYFNTQRMLEQYVLKAYFLERRPVSVPPPLRMSSIRKARARGMVSTRTTYQCDESVTVVDSGNQLWLRSGAELDACPLAHWEFFRAFGGWPGSRTTNFRIKLRACQGDDT